MKKVLFCVLVVGGLLFGACRHQELPEGVIDGERMASFLTEAYMLEASYAIGSHYNYDSINPDALLAYDTVLCRLDLDRATVEKSLDYYTKHPDEYAKIQAEVIRNLDQLGSEK